MKLAISAALLALLVGAPAYARQDPEREKEKPQQEERKKQEPDRKQPAEKEREKPPQDRTQEKQPPRDVPRQDKEQTDRTRQADRQQQQNEKQQQQNEKDRAKQDRGAQEQQQQAQRNGRTRDEHNNVQQAQRDSGNRNGRRIRDEDFRAHFGRQHAFRVSRRDDRRFNYGGYWFVYNDPWPAEWNYDDDVYVDEVVGEYYLIDPVHPGLRLVVIVGD
jgi:hypothetical protein